MIGASKDMNSIESLVIAKTKSARRFFASLARSQVSSAVTNVETAITSTMMRKNVSVSLAKSSSVTIVKMTLRNASNALKIIGTIKKTNNVSMELV